MTSKKDDFFKPKNAQTDRRYEVLSPSGKYKLVVTPFSTKKGSWNYTQGLVFTQGNDAPIAEVRRNYSSFPFLFIEEHPNGHDFLVCGEDYQGQTVIELDTGRRKDYLPEEAKDGVGFCWAAYTFDRDSQILVVDGCFWAGPYQYNFYDFSNPMDGWPELMPKDEEGKGVWVDSEGKAPTIEDDQITTYETHNLDADSMDVEEEDERHEVVARRVFKREGLVLVQQSYWISEEEQARRKAREEAQAAYEAKLAKWKAEDPLYLAHRELLKDPKLTPEKHASRGITYEGWCPHFDGKEGRWCQRIVMKHKTYTVDLEL